MRMTSRSGQHLATTKSIEGTKVRSADGHKVGEISSLVFDEDSGQIEYVVLNAGSGVLGVGAKFQPVPWSHLRFDPAQQGYTGDFDREAVKSAPAYDADQLNSTSYGWTEQVERHFGNAAPEDSTSAASQI